MVIALAEDGRFLFSLNLCRMSNDASQFFPPVYEYLHMHTSSDKFYFEPRQSNGNQIDEETSCLVVDRQTNEITVQSRNIIPQYVELRKIFGIFGIIRLITGPHIVVITKRFKLDEITGESIYRVEDTETIPYVTSIQGFTESEKKENEVFHSMIQSVLKIESFYLSYSFDVTHTRQRLQNSNNFYQQSLFDRADKRFVWNEHMVEKFISIAEGKRFVLPIMLGFIDIRSCQIAEKSFQLSLISRRSCLNAGVRFQKRGADRHGNVANFVESEQIMEIDQELTSFVQIRGSIPLFWTQKPNLRRTPTPRVVEGADNVSCFKKHVEDLLFHYKRICCLNLVDNKGYEKKMRDCMVYLCEKHIQNENINLINFDFHYECKNMNWAKFYEFIDSLDCKIIEFGYYVGRRLEDGYREAKRQQGVFRTNCMDCLDRTNVLQSLIAKRSLQYQLKLFKVIRGTETIDDNSSLDEIFKNLWADNGDFISIQYAGTRALKGDFTRTGNRTIMGFVNDGKNAATRWFVSNFRDGFRQDAIDLFLGRITLEDDMNKGKNNLQYNLQKIEFRHYLYGGFIAVVSLLIFYIFMRQSVNWHFGFILIIILVILVAYMWRNGEKLADRPRLISSKIVPYDWQ